MRDIFDFGGLCPVNLFCENNHISRNAFYKEAKAKRLHLVHVGRRTYVAPEDGRAWIEALRETVSRPASSSPEAPSEASTHVKSPKDHTL